MENPLALTNRWIVSKHEELALTDRDVDGECEVDSEGLFSEVELTDRLPLGPACPETKVAGANREL